MKPPHILNPPKPLCPTFDLFHVEGDPIFLVRTRVGMAVGMFSLSRQGGVERGGACNKSLAVGNKANNIYTG